MKNSLVMMKIIILERFGARICIDVKIKRIHDFLKQKSNYIINKAEYFIKMIYINPHKIGENMPQYAIFWRADRKMQNMDENSKFR